MARLKIKPLIRKVRRKLLGVISLPVIKFEYIEGIFISQGSGTVKEQVQAQELLTRFSEAFRKNLVDVRISDSELLFEFREDPRADSPVKEVFAEPVTLDLANTIKRFFHFESFINGDSGDYTVLRVENIYGIDDGFLLTSNDQLIYFFRALLIPVK